MPRLRVYVRVGCGLCDEMVAALAQWQGQPPLEVETIDVDSEPGLQREYGSRVPVLVGTDGREICHYFLDGRALQRYFASR